VEASQPLLPPEIEAAVAQQHGGPVCVSGAHGNYIVMDADMCHDQVESDPQADLHASVAALRISIAQAAAGQTIPLDQARKGDILLF